MRPSRDSRARRGRGSPSQGCSSTPRRTARRARRRSRAPTRRTSETGASDVRIKAGMVGLALALVALVPPPSAMAAGEPAFGCGHIHTAEAQRNPYGPNDGPPPIAIGDSTMLLPIPDLTRVGFDVNAKGCRGFKQSIWVARDLRSRGELPKMILINAYGNGGVDDDLIKFALKVIGPKRTLVLVTAYNADTGEPPAPDTDVLVKAAQDHPDQIRLL